MHTKCDKQRAGRGTGGYGGTAGGTWDTQAKSKSVGNRAAPPLAVINI